MFGMGLQEIVVLAICLGVFFVPLILVLILKFHRKKPPDDPEPG